MIDPRLVETATVAGASLIALAIMCLAMLRGWQGWLALQERMLDRSAPSAAGNPAPLDTASARIELADLRERVRQLEAIAAGVDP